MAEPSPECPGEWGEVLVVDPAPGDGPGADHLGPCGDTVAEDVGDDH